MRPEETIGTVQFKIFIYNFGTDTLNAHQFYCPLPPIIPMIRGSERANGLDFSVPFPFNPNEKQLVLLPFKDTRMETILQFPIGCCYIEDLILRSRYNKQGIKMEWRQRHNTIIITLFNLSVNKVVIENPFIQYILPLAHNNFSNDQLSQLYPNLLTIGKPRKIYN